MLGDNVVPNRLGYGMLGEWGPTDFIRGSKSVFPIAGVRNGGR